MATCFCGISSLQMVIFAVSFAVLNEALECNFNLTRLEITALLGQQTNLGCYATTNLTNSSLNYSWTKDNRTVTQSSKVEVFGNILVVTPGEATDFGTYECKITNGVTSTLCTISLEQGLDKPDDSTTGCVNVSVLMPVLAVAVMSLLLFIHIVLQCRGRRQNDHLTTKRKDESNLRKNDHNRVIEASAVDEGEPIELQANGRVSRMSRNELTVQENEAVTQF